MKALLRPRSAGAKAVRRADEHVNQMGMDNRHDKCDYEARVRPEPTDGSNPKPSFRFEITDVGNMSGAMGMGFTPDARHLRARDRHGLREG